MTKKERVLAAILHQEVDRVPKGELAIDHTLTNKLLVGEEFGYLSPLQKEIEVRKLLGCDLINVHEFPRELVRYDVDGFPIYRSAWGDEFKDTGRAFKLIKPAIEDIEDADEYRVTGEHLVTTHLVEYYAKNTDFFIFAQINGPVSALDWMLGMEDYMVYTMTETEAIRVLAEKVMDFEVSRAIKFIDKGADAILIADDIAFNGGLLLPPDKMREVAYPIYKACVQKIKAHKNVPVFIHSDGYLYDALEELVDCGFDGIQSLQSSAGMDIQKVKEEFGDKLCLMGNVDLDYLLPFGTVEEVENEVKKLIEIANQNGGFILSTSNILTDIVKPENAVAMYRIAEEY